MRWAGGTGTPDAARRPRARLPLGASGKLSRATRDGAQGTRGRARGRRWARGGRGAEMGRGRRVGRGVLPNRMG